jgi:hypothetical protein
VNICQFTLFEGWRRRFTERFSRLLGGSSLQSRAKSETDTLLWEPIDSAPQDGTAVLLFHPAWDIARVGLRYQETGKWQEPDGDLLQAPAFWAPLPSLPKTT